MAPGLAQLVPQGPGAMELDLVTQREGGVGRLSDSPDVFGDAHGMWAEPDKPLPSVTEWRASARR